MSLASIPFPSSNTCAFSRHVNVLSHLVVSSSLYSVHCSLPGCSLYGKNAAVGCHFLPQGIFPTQGPASPSWQLDSLPLSHQGSLIFEQLRFISCFAKRLILQTTSLPSHLFPEELTLLNLLVTTGKRVPFLL